MNIIFKSIVGSQAYGTNTVGSDTDYKGVYVQPTRELVGFGYKEQIEVSKDECYYEVRRFLQLLKSANPTMLELLFMPEDCIIEKHPAFDLILKHRDKFLTKKCLHSFGGYAVAQIKKAKGLDKKMNWEKERMVRKSLMEFCYVYQNGKTKALSTFLAENNIDEKDCGLVGLAHFRNCYALYHDPSQTMGYRGILSKNGDNIKLSSVPKGEKDLTVLHFNKDGYSTHCKDYLQYTDWLKNRNTQRYVDIETHGQQIDGKNLLHCKRLLDMALEIAEQKTIIVRRPNAQDLLKIRRGEINLEQFMEKAENDILKLNAYFEKSDLPDEVDDDFVNELLLEVREMVITKTDENILKDERGPHYQEQDDTLPPAILCDLDGTLAILYDRGPFDSKRCETDLLNIPIAEIVKTYHKKGVKIILMSRREDVSRSQTMNWLSYNKIPYNALYMRKSGDMRKDAVIKKELYEAHVKGQFFVQFVLDDRNQVVDLWRLELGLPCFQVNYGDF